MILGITGGMGCGKTTAARQFEQRGYRRVDSDALVRERILPSEEVRLRLGERFGSAVFGEGGALDRGALAARVFEDDADRHWLEALVHPAVFALWREALASEPSADWAVEVPLLFEAGVEIWFDFTVCVACSEEEQLLRLERRGLARVLAGQRISKQLPLARKIELADFVLWNDGSSHFLKEQVTGLIAAFALRPAPTQ
ncbi:MAG: dephospho-CoA kinase [Opitutaceae bacterium]